MIFGADFRDQFRERAKTSRMRSNDLHTSLDSLADHLIHDLTKGPSPIREGIVMTMGNVPYRRLDCDGRALAYVRTRRRKNMIRVDISGLWAAPRKPESAIPGSQGTISFAVRTENDRVAAVGYLTEVVTHTRALVDARKAREREVLAAKARAARKR